MARQLTPATARQMFLDTQSERQRFNAEQTSRGARRPEEQGNFFKLEKFWQATTDIQVSADLAKKYHLDGTVGFLGKSGKTYLAHANGAFDEISIRTSGEVSLKRDDSHRANRPVASEVSDEAFSVVQDMSSADALQSIRQRSVAAGSRDVNRIADMLKEACFVEKQTTGREWRPPAVWMTLQHGDEKAYIAQQAASTRPFMFTNSPAPGLGRRLKEAIANFAKSPLFQQLVGSVSVAAVAIGALASLPGSLNDYNPFDSSAPAMTRVMYDDQTGHIDIAQIDGNEVTVLRNLNGDRSFNEMTGSLNDEFLAGVASDAAAYSSEFTGAHVERAMTDTEELRHSWTQEFGENANVMMKMFRNDDVLTVESDGANIKTSFSHANSDPVLTGEAPTYLTTTYIGDYGANEASMDSFLTHDEASDRASKRMAEHPLVKSVNEAVAQYENEGLTAAQEDAIASAHPGTSEAWNGRYVPLDGDMGADQSNSAQLDPPTEDSPRVPSDVSTQARNLDTQTFSPTEGYEEIAKLLGPELEAEFGVELAGAQQFAAMSFDDEPSGQKVTLDAEQLEVAMDHTKQEVKMKTDRVAIDPESLSFHPDNRIAIEFDESMVTENNSTPGMSR